MLSVWIWKTDLRFAVHIGLFVALGLWPTASRAEIVQIDNQRGEKVKFCAYRSDDRRLVRPRTCWMMKPGRRMKWNRGTETHAFDVRLFEPGAFELPICMKRKLQDSYAIIISPRSSKKCVTPMKRLAFPAQQWTRGDRVLVNAGADGFWYPATIVGEAEPGYRVRLDSQRLEAIQPRYIVDLVIRAGMRVEVNWKNQGRWYPGIIRSSNGNRAAISYDDGTEEDADVALMRVDLSE